MRVLIISVVGALLGGCGQAPIPIAASQPMQEATARAPEWQVRHLARAACPQVIGEPTCLALQVLKGGTPLSCPGPSNCGWTAPQLEAAYNITGDLRKGSGTNVALIEVGDLPNAASDFATYRKAFALGAGHLTKYNQYGQQSHYPASCVHYHWCGESELDMDMVAAACPKCNVLMVEAKGSTNFYGGVGSLEAAETQAVKLGATIVSNSWICYGSLHCDCGDPDFSKYFDTPGITYLAGSGDESYDEIGPPSALASVIAVGGTQLSKDGSKYTETFWGDAGSGCAGPKEVGGSGIAKPSWQKDPDCSYRTDADVSAEAGCEPGIAVYTGVYGGWSDWCGTSVATPLTAGVIALAGNAGQLDAGRSFWTFDHTKADRYFNHPGGKGALCHSYLCGHGRYKSYYSGPGGWGSPNGTEGY